MIHEERRVRLVSEAAWPDYRRWALNALWPALEAAGATPLVLLNGLIGKGVQDAVVIVGFPDFEARQTLQPLFADGPTALVDVEEVHLVESSRFTADRGAPEDRRAIYGLRRWWIAPEDWDEFVQMSYEGIWPAMDYMGHCAPATPNQRCRLGVHLYVALTLA